MKILLVCFLSLFASSASGDESVYKFCTANQQQQIITAVNHVRRMIYIAATSKDDDLFKKWFGAQATALNFRDNLWKLRLPLSNQSFDCSCSSESFTFVIKEIPYTVHICNRFWRAEIIGYNSMSGAIIHEYSHFENILNTTDFNYDYSAALNFAIQNPDIAFRNANNWEFLLEELYRKQSKH